MKFLRTETDSRQMTHVMSHNYVPVTPQAQEFTDDDKQLETEYSLMYY